MGQYHFPINLDKGEWINPHELGDGLKLGELGSTKSGRGGTSDALVLLLAASNAQGGYHVTHGMIGHWAGDRVAIIGDCDDESHLNSYYDLTRQPAEEGGLINITAKVREALQLVHHCVYWQDESGFYWHRHP
jgi:hypothetical protein